MEITEINPEGRHHPDLIWVPCDNDVDVRDYYNSETGEYIKFVLPSAPAVVPEGTSNPGEFLTETPER